MRHRGLKKPSPSCFEDFHPPEATTFPHRGVKYKTFNFLDLRERGWLVCRDGPRPGLGPARMSCLPGSRRIAWVRKSSVGLQVQRGSVSLAWVSKSGVGLQVERGSPSLAWLFKSSVESQVLPGTTSLTWNYKSSLGLQAKRQTSRQAPVMELTTHKKCD